MTNIPEVIVMVGDRDRLSSALAESTAKAKKLSEFEQAYKNAYRGHRGWFKAIAPYFDEDDDGDE